MIEASGLEARVIQHEMDHLNGVLILDRTPRDQRKEAHEDPARAARAERRRRAPPDARACAPSTSARRTFAVAVLRRLADSPHRPSLVVTRPDRPEGPRAQLPRRPPPTAARELGIELLQPESVTRRRRWRAIAAAEPDAVLVCAFGALIKEPLLSDYQILNVHPSLLPRWRGAAPIERAIMAGDAETGVAIMRLTAGLDSGPVALQEREPIRPDDDFGSLSARLARARRRAAGRRRSTSGRRSTSSPRRA